MRSKVEITKELQSHWFQESSGDIPHLIAVLETLIEVQIDIRDNL